MELVFPVKPTFSFVHYSIYRFYPLVPRPPQWGWFELSLYKNIGSIPIILWPIANYIIILVRVLVLLWLWCGFLFWWFVVLRRVERSKLSPKMIEKQANKFEYNVTVKYFLNLCDRYNFSFTHFIIIIL